jgi:hypothetical protein
MSYLVTLDVFSGRENPSWVVTEEQAKEMQNKSRDHAKALKSSRPAGKLGYRGVHVQPIKKQDKEPMMLTESVGDHNDGHYVSGIPELEDFLVSTGKQHVDGTIADHIQQELMSAEEISPEAMQAVSCPVCQAKDAPAYNPGWWNVPARQPHNNCYAYANNQATNTFPQPGRATGRPITALSCPGVQPSSVSDGLRAVGGFNQPLAVGQGWYVALVIWPGVDYHWYRQDSVGCWSHKPGSTPVRDVDNSGNKITDPKTCDRGSYTDFCTYMITGNWVTIR